MLKHMILQVSRFFAQDNQQISRGFLPASIQSIYTDSCYLMIFVGSNNTLW